MIQQDSLKQLQTQFFILSLYKYIFKSKNKGSWDNSLKLWCLKTFTCLDTLNLNRYNANCLRSIDSENVACGLNEGSIGKFNLNSFKMIQKLKVEQFPITFIVTTSDGLIISAAKRKCWITIVDEKSFTVLRKLSKHRDSVMYMDVPFENKLISGSIDNYVMIWDILTGDCLEKIDMKSKIMCVKFVNPNLLIVGLCNRDESLKIYDMDKKCFVATLYGHSKYINGIETLEEKSLFFSFSNDATIRAWNLMAYK
jgi:WD40 repeat protein